MTTKVSITLERDGSDLNWEYEAETDQDDGIYEVYLRINGVDVLNAYPNDEDYSSSGTLSDVTGDIEYYAKAEYAGGASEPNEMPEVDGTMDSGQKKLSASDSDG